MQWQKAAEFPADQDLSRVDRQLREQGVVHRFTMEAEGQVLWLSDTEDAQQVLEQVKLWLQRPDLLKPGPQYKLGSRKTQFQISGKPAPVTLALVALSFAGAALYAFGEQFVDLFTFWHPDNRFTYGASKFAAISAGEYWRLITPIFIHFSPSHSIFNALWLWYLGTMIERYTGIVRLLTLVILIGLLSNVAQALVSSYYAIFGGMSGVAFGLLSYVWLAQRLGGPEGYQLSDPLFFFMTGYMLLSTLGLFDWLAGGDIADTAHIVGYIAGMIFALVFHLRDKPARANDV